MNGETPTATAQPGTQFTIRHKGQILAQVDTLEAALAWLLANQPDSAKTAVENGYQVTDQAGRRWFGPKRRF